MSRASIVEKVKEMGLVPIIRTPTAEDAVAIGEILRDFKVTNLEITLTVPGAVEAIANLVKKFGDEVMVGAGTVLDKDAAKACIDAGAKFIISPAVDIPTIKFCNSADIPVFPGALTPTEALSAWQAGADMIKIFPASAMGGASYIKAIKAPLPQIDIIPTGGVNLATAADYIKAGASALGVGSDLVNLKALNSGDLSIIGTNVQKYIEIVKQARA